MRLIHLPSGEKHELSEAYLNAVLKSNYYIRTTLPEYWRVEGYDKSLEWAKYQPAYDPSEHRWDFVTNKKGRNVFDRQISDVTFMQLPQISRAEFEYHIYNPWREGQAQLDMSDIDKLRQQAEKMGYELVRKEKDMIEWETEHNAFKLIDAGLWIKNLDDDERIFLENHEFDILIEKHNQFSSK